MRTENRKCAFRLDDITCDMNWDTFYAVKSVFDKYGIKPLIGVVPDNQDENLKKGQECSSFWEVIRELQKNGWCIAQHGYQHVYSSHNSGLLGLKDRSEFAGLSYPEQYGKIRRGKEILQKQGIYVTIFMAPGHTFDQNTLRALKASEFKYITDGYAYKDYKRLGIIHIPCRTSNFCVGKGIDTICLHTNSMSADHINDLNEFIGKNRKYLVDYTELLNRTEQPNISFIWPQERWNLLKWRMKRFVSSSETIHFYLVETNHQNPKRKMGQRILRLPVLIFRLLTDRKKKSDNLRD